MYVALALALQYAASARTLNHTVYKRHFIPHGALEEVKINFVNDTHAGSRLWLSESAVVKPMAAEPEGYQWLARLTDCRNDMQRRWGSAPLDAPCRHTWCAGGGAAAASGHPAWVPAPAFSSGRRTGRRARRAAATSS
jgi:hypothetical protein